MRKFIDITDGRFGRWTVIDKAKGALGGEALWICLCECGNTKTLAGNVLRSGKSRSCGCLKKEKAIAAKTTHGMLNTKEYRSWSHMKNRCLNHKDPHYTDYGARGITVCEEWKNSFEAFFADMGIRPEGNFSIDRIDNDKGYSKENCRWVTGYTQSNNRRNPKTNTSGFVGVYKKGKKWAALICRFGKRTRLGFHSTPELAAEAYNTAKKEAAYV